jgi:spermidine synthase
MEERLASVPLRNYSELFLISFLALFFELTCIRWFGSYVVFLTFFTNIVLLASFLGLGVGCLAAGRQKQFINWLPPLILVATISAVATHVLYEWNDRLVIGINNQQIVYFGTEYRHPDISTIAVPLEVVAGFFFLLIAVVFVGLGQVLGRKLEAVPSRILGYTTNISGSIFGILAFSLISFRGLSPIWWFAITLSGVCYFLSGRRRFINCCYTVMTVLFVGVIALGIGRNTQIYWSPYSQISYYPTARAINSNNISHQVMISLESSGMAYLLPYFLTRDTQRQPIRDVLIIGAGSGNDVSAALRLGAERVDAVEVDPVIYNLGKRFHPDRPYQSPRVQIHIDDGRNFLRKSDQQYDLIIYALVDSLVLHSGYSSIRLESFLFTREAFADIKSHLRANGLFVAYNFFRQGWIVARLAHMAEEVFGRKPLVFSFPYRPEIDATTAGGFTMILGGDTEQIAALFSAKGTRKFATPHLPVQRTLAGAGGNVRPGPFGNVVEIGPSTVKEHGNSLLPDDNWPFLYLREPLIPALTMYGMLTIAVLSVLVLAFFAPTQTVHLNWSMFFLGAGFMLLETKGVVHMALLFGSTWTVNAIVFVAILVMILLSNLFVLKFQPGVLTRYYVLLVFFLGLNAFVDLNSLLGLPEAARASVACLILFLPIFFAGIIFAANFGRSANPDHDFGSNIAGAVLGGLAENLSLMLGFRYLMLVAILFYILARGFQTSLVPRAS